MPKKTAEQLARQLDKAEHKAFRRRAKEQELSDVFEFVRLTEEFSGQVYRERLAGNAQAFDEELMARSMQHLIDHQFSDESARGYSQWVNGYRQIWKDNLSLFWLCFAVFFGSLVLGYYIGNERPEYASVLFPQQLQEEMVLNVPWFERIKDDPVGAGLSIASNNIGVAIKAFVGGALFGLGSLYILIFNGVFIGAILGYCHRFGFRDELLNFISSHGPLELTAIIAAAFSGLVFAKGYFAGPLAGMAGRLKRSATEAMHLALGMIPWLAVAAVFEAFVSPFDYLNFQGKLMVGVMIAAAFWYWSLKSIKIVEPSS